MDVYVKALAIWNIPETSVYFESFTQEKSHSFARRHKIISHDCVY